ncbi:MAG: HD domain-containing protein [Anaerolineales bacterium]|nr:HD domain-containing protein [Anaerolineales bacterium]
MKTISIPVVILAGISFYAGFYHLIVYMRTREDKKQLSFALTCIAVGFYDVFAVGVYNANSVAQAAFWQRSQVIAMMLSGAAFLWFIADYTSQRPKKALILFTAYFLLSAFVHVVDRSDLTWLSLDHPSIKNISLPNGFTVTYYEMSPGLFTDIQSFFSIPIYIFLMFMGIRYFRAGNQRAAAPLLISLTLFWIGVFNDSLVSSGVYQFIYVVEYSFMAIILLMAISLAHDIASVTDSLRESVKTIETQSNELAMAYDATLQGWAKALELYDQETEGHSRRVVDMTLRIAQTFNLCRDELVAVHRGVLLHDIGKMAIPSDILQKPGPLSEDEWEVMRQHPNHAYELLQPITYLQSALDIPYCHHERWDGKGYPRGLKGEQIPLAARIFSIVDVWDALLSDRPYRKAWPRSKTLKYIKENAGIRFDPVIVDIFFQKLE